MEVELGELPSSQLAVPIYRCDENNTTWPGMLLGWSLSSCVDKDKRSIEIEIRNNSDEH